jgi:hypothetical protein
MKENNPIGFPALLIEPATFQKGLPQQLAMASEAHNTRRQEECDCSDSPDNPNSSHAACPESII